jgi:hypothetical protein
MFLRIVRAVFEDITTKIHRHPAFFVVLGALVIFSTVLIKDNIAEGVRSNIQAVEFAKQFYELHIEDIDLNSRLNEVGDSVEELSRLVSKEDIPGALQETMNTAIRNHNEAAKNAKLIQATNDDTEELVRRVGDSTLFFTYSDGEATILRNDLQLSGNRLEALRSDIKTLNDEWNETNRLASVANPQYTSEQLAKIVEAYKKFSHDAEAAAIQSEHLEALSLENRARALKVAELYRQFLEEENTICKWAIIILVVVGSALGLLSQLAGVQEGPAKNP